MLRRNSLKQKLSSQPYVIGTFLETPSPYLVEMLGLAGFDFVIIDREHGPIDLAATEHLIRASLATDMAAVVRVPQCDPVSIRQPLDMGATAVQIPQIESAALARLAARSCYFHPHGDRGVQPFVRAASFRLLGAKPYFELTDADTAIIVHIEGAGGVAEIDEILAVERLDVIFLGPYDLSQALGVPGQTSHPLVQSTMEAVIRKTRAAGKIAGCYCDSAESAAAMGRLGVQYLAVGIDVKIFLEAASDLTRRLRGALE